MSSGKDTRADSYVPNPLVSGVYAKVSKLDDDVLESLCPSYLSLDGDGERYQDKELLGQGALKDVYRAYDRLTERWVAFASLREDRGVLFYDHFVREARLIASLRHPNIIKVHDAGVDAEGRPFFTMDLKGNTSLADLIRKREERSLSDLLEVFSKVCDAIAYAHSQNVIHLDLKPENIQCDRFGEVLVCDWGLGKLLGESESESDDLDADSAPEEESEESTLTGEVKGSLGYMAPEQVNAELTKAECTDVYALGCILHSILCGEPPFTGTLEQVLKDTEESEVLAPGTRFPERSIPASLEAVVMKATAKVPKERYGSVLSLQKDIQKYIGGFPTEAEEPGFFREARLFIERNRLPVGILFAAIVMFTVLSVLFVQSLKNEKMATSEERIRADRLLSEKALISSEYASFSEESILSKKELATRMTFFARRIKIDDVYDRPIESVAQAEQMLHFALRLYPESERAHWERFLLNCTKMDFKRALSEGIPKPPNDYSDLIAMAESFSNYGFSKEERPTKAQLITFLDRARSFVPRYLGFVERIFTYHVAVQPEDATDPEIIRAFLGFFNGGMENVQVSYDLEDEAMEIITGKSLRLLLVNRAASKRSSLRFFRIRALKLETAGKFEISDLDRLPLESLDLSNCAEISLSKLISLPRLKTLRIREGQIKRELLDELILSNRVFEIIEVPDLN